MNDVREIWIETSQVALSIVEDPRVSAGWSDASSLPMMTIGSVVGHLLHSGILLLEESLDEPVPAGRPLTTAEIFSVIPIDADDGAHEAVREVASAQEAGGLRDLLERAIACRERLVVRVREEPPDRVIGLAGYEFPLPWRLDEFIAARILELVVHLDDLATSIDALDLTPPADAITLACHLGIDISMRRHGPMPVLQALYRSDRNLSDALRPF